MTFGDDFRDSLREILRETRAIPGQLGLRPYSVDFVTKEWSGGDLGIGSEVETLVPILHADGQHPKVSMVSEHRIALGIGLEIGDVTIGPITPTADAEWTTLLQTNMQDYDQLIVRLTHLETGIANDYRLHHVQRNKALTVTLTAKPVV